MESVAGHLKNEAMARKNIHERDVFGRSSFNRYYYATYLLVREGFACFHTAWANNLPHADIPEMLRGKIKQNLKKGRQKALRAEDFDVLDLCERALAAVNDLANLMDEGRITRVVADYKPELLVDFTQGADYSLNTISVQEAQKWPYKARHYLSTISVAWKQIND